MAANGIGHLPGGLGIATRLALLEMEAEQAQYQADCTIRDASREAKRQHNERQVEEMRNKATALMTQAFTAGALQVAAGAAQLAGASSRLDAGQAKVDANRLAHSSDARGQDALLQEQYALRSRALQAEATANRLCAAATLLNAGAETVKALTNAAASGRDADIASAAKAAEDAGWRADDANESARRRLNQLDQKLAIIQRMLDDDADTRRALLRG